jgi:hypothetical protein
MAKTLVSDVIVPTLFEKYAIERTAELSAFGRCGIVAEDSRAAELAAGPAKYVDLPFWQDLSATRQLLSDSGTLSVNKITASKDSCRIHNDAQVWSVNWLSEVLSGGDPMGAIVQLVADYWARIDEGLLVSSLKGMFTTGGTLVSTNKLAIASESIAGQTSTTRLNGSTFVDACAKLGDRGDALTAVAMHSATEAALRKLDLIDFIPDSQGPAQIRVFQGRRVVVDDNLPYRNGTTDGVVYQTFLFGPGAFVHGAAPLSGVPLMGGHGTEGVELYRAALDSDTVLINRRRFILHPRGVKFTAASVAADSPTNAELETASNWTRVYEAKNVRIVCVEHNN